MLNILQFICTLLCLKFAFGCLFYNSRTNTFHRNCIAKRHLNIKMNIHQRFIFYEWNIKAYRIYEYFRVYETNDEAIFHLYHCEQKGGIQNIIFFIVNSGDECPWFFYKFVLQAKCRQPLRNKESCGWQK